jgi:hypothetical protein
MNQSISQDIQNQRNQSYIIALSGINSINTVPILPKGWKETVKNAISSRLKDSESAKYDFRENPVYCSFSNIGRFAPGHREFTSPILGYAGLVFVNAKNSYGGYVGYTPWFFMITDGRVSILERNGYGLWNTLPDVIAHLNSSFSETLIIK